MGAGASTNSGSEAKISGDRAFRSGDFREAILWWTQAILGHSETVSRASSVRELAILHTNRSVAYYKIGLFETGLADGQEAISIDPLWFKGHYVMSKALLALGHDQQAASALSKAVALSNNRILVEEYSKLQQVLSVQRTARHGCIYSWGAAQTGALGFVSARDCCNPTRIDSLRGKHIVDASCGAMHCAAVTGLGEVYSWGNNKYGQTGHGNADVDQVDNPSIVSSMIGTFVSAVSCGSGHVVVTTADGRVYSWGMGGHGQLGHGNTLDVALPVKVEALSSARVCAVATGIAHSLFLLDNGTVVACGMNTFGSLGRDTGGSSVLTPVPISLEPTGHDTQIVHIAAGGAHTMLLSTSGYLFSAGSNSCGQLGQGNNIENSTCFRCITVDRTQDAKFVFVSCGEEFTIAVSFERRVFSCGLGVAGQLGNGSFEDQYSFGVITALDGCHIENVTCSQGAVFALSSTGAVYNWGAQLFCASVRRNNITSDPADLAASSTPCLSRVFSNRKRARHISCGRKHYLLLAVSPYGPKSRIIPESWRGCNPHAISADVVAGTNIRCTIQSVDELGSVVVYGGAFIVATAVRSLATQQEGNFDGQELDINSTVIVDDNLDGTYDVSIKLFVSGSYHVSIYLDELHIESSPFLFSVTPTTPEASRSRIVGVAVASRVYDIGCYRLMVPHFENSRDIEANKSTITAPCGGILQVDVRLADMYGNALSDCSCNSQISVEWISCRKSFSKCGNAIYNVCDSSVPILHSFEPLSVSLTATLLFRLNCQIPAFEDDYQLNIFLDSFMIGTVTVKAVEKYIYAALASIEAPHQGNVEATYTITVRPHEGTCTALLTKDFGSLLRSVIKPQECDISARALIHLATTKDMEVESIGVVTWSTVGGHANLSHTVQHAGNCELTVWIDNAIALQREIFFSPGMASPKFTEVLSPRTALSSWSPVVDSYRDIIVQCRDSFGNKIRVGGDAVFASLLAVSCDHHHISKEILRVIDLENGTYSIRVMSMPTTTDSSYELEVKLNTEEILYSPFSLERNKFEEYKREIAEREGENKVDFAPAIKRTMSRAEKFLLGHITRKQAIDRLRQEQQRTKDEKSERNRKKSVKRTGGGFIIQYSKDI